MRGRKPFGGWPPRCGGFTTRAHPGALRRSRGRRGVLRRGRSASSRNAWCVSAAHEMSERHTPRAGTAAGCAVPQRPAQRQLPRTTARSGSSTGSTRGWATFLRPRQPVVNHEFGAAEDDVLLDAYFDDATNSTSLARDDESWSDFRERIVGSAAEPHPELDFNDNGDAPLRPSELRAAGA